MPGSLSHSPAEIVAALLVSSGVGSDPLAATLGSWPVYTGNEPALPDDVITVYDTQGRDYHRSQADGERAETYGVQVRVRSTGHAAGYPKANAVAVALDAMTTVRAVVSVGGTQYRINGIERSGAVLPLGTEAPNSRRVLFVINALASIRKVT